MRARQRGLDAGEVVVAHAELAERQRARPGIEHPQDRRLTGYERDDRDADVDPPPLERDAHAAVLRQAALGDVELAEDLDARDDLRGLALRDRRRRGHDPVDPVAHAQLAVVRVEVHVGRARLDRVGDDRAHELDGRGVVGGGFERVRDLLVGIRLDLEVVVEVGLEVVDASQQDVEVLARDDDRLDAHVGEHREVVEREHIRRIGHRDEQDLVAVADRHGVQAPQRGSGHEVQSRDVRPQRLEADVLQAEALGDGDRELVGCQRGDLDQHLAHRTARGAGVGDGLLDGLAVAQAEAYEHVAEQATGPRAGRHGIRYRRGGHRVQYRHVAGILNDRRTLGARPCAQRSGTQRVMPGGTSTCERTVELPATAAAAGIARRELAATPGIAGDLGYRVLLMASELIAVFVADMEPRPDRVLRLSVVVAPEHVRIEVAGDTPEVSPDALVHSRETPSLGGMGLQIVERMADGWGVTGDGAAEIWFELRR